MAKRNIVHIEIPSANFEASGRFYHELFGWKITPMPELDYALWEPSEGPGGGFNPVGPETKVGDVLIHVDSDDIGADLKRAAELGGTVLKGKAEIPGWGWYGVFRDPTGNAIALYTARQADGRP
jgi:hypothetical protein